MEDVGCLFSGSVPAHSLLSDSRAFPSVLPQLVILNHRTHAEEVVIKNGFQTNIHVVVKNSPFHFHLGVTNAHNARVDFHSVAFEVFLLYDCDDLKEVDYVKAKPLDFKSEPSENGSMLEVELRIKTLTSQHEDMLFRVKLQGYDPLTRAEFPGLCVISPPIKVISKPEQLKKRQPSKKRTLTDSLMDTILRIEKKQEEQQKLIEEMIQENISKRVKPEPQVSLERLPVKEKKHVPEEEIPLVEFEDAFSDLLDAYNALQMDEKPETIRKVVRSSSAEESERLSELLDFLWTEGLDQDPSDGSHTEGCACSTCPYKLELERIDVFYKEFLSTGSGVQVPSF